MRRLRIPALLLALCLMFGAPAAAVDSISLGGLTGHRYLVLGDSLTAGYGLDHREQDWSYLMAVRFGMNQLNASISGSTIAAGPTGAFPIVDRCLLLVDDDGLDFILIQGGINDWSRAIPMGGDDSRNPFTFCGAINRILDLLSERYPGAALVGFTPWRSDDTTNALGWTLQDYTDAMLRLFSARDLLCYNASDVEANGIAMDQESFRAQYCLATSDWYHLNAMGHLMFAPVFSSWLEENLYPASAASQYYDLAQAPEDMRRAATNLLADGVLTSVSEHLFAPTRAATRADLALALYRLAGSPDPEPREIADLSPEDPAYDAVCWAMEAGVFSPADAFSPDQFLSREMLSAVVYRYYTGFAGNFAAAMVGLGSFPDGAAVSGYAKTGMGWALSSGVLESLDGRLSPQGAVSRGQLALSISALREIS